MLSPDEQMELERLSALPVSDMGPDEKVDEILLSLRAVTDTLKSLGTQFSANPMAALASLMGGRRKG